MKLEYSFQQKQENINNGDLAVEIRIKFYGKTLEATSSLGVANKMIMEPLNKQLIMPNNSNEYINKKR